MLLSDGGHKGRGDQDGATRQRTNTRTYAYLKAKLAARKDANRQRAGLEKPCTPCPWMGPGSSYRWVEGASMGRNIPGTNVCTQTGRPNPEIGVA